MVYEKDNAAGTWQPPWRYVRREPMTTLMDRWDYVRGTKAYELEAKKGGSRPAMALLKEITPETKSELEGYISKTVIETKDLYIAAAALYPAFKDPFEVSGNRAEKAIGGWGSKPDKVIEHLREIFFQTTNINRLRFRSYSGNHSVLFQFSIM